MLLTVDVGNTNLVFGVFKGEMLTQSWRLATLRERTADEHGILVSDLFQARGLDKAEIDGVIMASVVPPLTGTMSEMIMRYFDLQTKIVDPVEDAAHVGMPIRYDRPSEVGADRIVNSVAAYELFGGPVIAVDFGTATTFDCVSKKGEYMGGCLFPGIHISMDALFERTSKLPRVEIARPKHVIGKTTTGALQSGLLYGYAGMVDSMVERIQPELGDDPARVIATGGLAGRIARESNTIEEVVPFLTLEGLRILFEKNR